MQFEVAGISAWGCGMDVGKNLKEIRLSKHHKPSSGSIKRVEKLNILDIVSTIRTFPPYLITTLPFAS